MELVILNCLCVIICTSFAVKYAQKMARQELITLYLCVIYLFKLVDEVAGKDGFCFERIQEMNGGKDEKENS